MEGDLRHFDFGAYAAGHSVDSMLAQLFAAPDRSRRTRGVMVLAASKQSPIVQELLEHSTQFHRNRIRCRTTVMRQGFWNGLFGGGSSGAIQFKQRRFPRMEQLREMAAFGSEAIWRGAPLGAAPLQPNQGEWISRYNDPEAFDFAMMCLDTCWFPK
ncbi:MAG: hypothetical protein MRY74_10200 [Neomegalonema sp.]|nr:hypothetical protein [Neomegalonema sp.]